MARASQRGVRIGVIFVNFGPPVLNPGILGWRFPSKNRFRVEFSDILDFGLIFVLKSALPTERRHQIIFKPKRDFRLPNP